MLWWNLVQAYLNTHKQKLLKQVASNRQMGTNKNRKKSNRLRYGDYIGGVPISAVTSAKLCRKSNTYSPLSKTSNGFAMLNVHCSSSLTDLLRHIHTVMNPFALFMINTWRWCFVKYRTWCHIRGLGTTGFPFHCQTMIIIIFICVASMSKPQSHVKHTEESKWRNSKAAERQHAYN